MTVNTQTAYTIQKGCASGQLEYMERKRSNIGRYMVGIKERDREGERERECRKERKCVEEEKRLREKKE